MESFGLTVLIVAAVGSAAIASNRLSEWTRVPAPAFFLVAAAVASDLVPSLRHLGLTTIQDLVTVALAVLLFDGGMHIGWRRFRPAAAAIAWIGVVGTFATAAAVSVIAHYLVGFGWLAALLLGTAVAPTDPAVVFSVLGRREITGRSGTLLEGESGANDPVGIALVAALLTAGGMSGLSAAGDVAVVFVEQMAIGAAVGLLGGVALRWLIARVALPSEALYPLRTLAGSLAVFGVANVAHGSGFLAVFIAGILLGDLNAPYKPEIERFHSALASVAEIVAFVALGLTVSLHGVFSDGSWVDGLVVAVVLSVVVRPAIMALLLWPVELRAGERAFVALAGLKGAVPILLGSFALTSSLASGHTVYDIVFVVVAFSVVVQGGLVPTLARVLHVPMRSTELEPWSVGVRLRTQPAGLRRYRVAPKAAADGAAVAELELPEGFWISMLIRGSDLLPVTGETRLQADDQVLALTDPESPDASAHLFVRPRTDRG